MGFCRVCSSAVLVLSDAEFICISAPLYLENAVSCSSCLPSPIDPWALMEGLNKDIPFWVECSKVSHCILHSFGVCVNYCLLQETSLRRLSNLMICGYSNVSLVNFLVMSFSKKWKVSNSSPRILEDLFSCGTILLVQLLGRFLLEVSRIVSGW